MHEYVRAVRSAYLDNNVLCSSHVSCICTYRINSHLCMSNDSHQELLPHVPFA
jgi:hypothetical protein